MSPSACYADISVQLTFDDNGEIVTDEDPPRVGSFAAVAPGMAHIRDLRSPYKSGISGWIFDNFFANHCACVSVDQTNTHGISGPAGHIDRIALDEHKLVLEIDEFSYWRRSGRVGGWRRQICKTKIQEQT